MHANQINVQYHPDPFSLKDTEVIFIKCLQVDPLINTFFTESGIIQQDFDRTFIERAYLESYYHDVPDNHLSDYLGKSFKRIELNATHTSWVTSFDLVEKLAALIQVEKSSV